MVIRYDLIIKHDDFQVRKLLNYQRIQDEVSTI